MKRCSNLPTTDEIDVDILVNPKREVHVTYTLDGDIFQHDSDVSLSIPGYSYDYYSLRGITWPLSLKVRELDSQLESVAADGGEINQNLITLSATKDGDFNITIPERSLQTESIDALELHVKIPNMVNQDIVFHNMIFAVTEPALETGRKYFDPENEPNHFAVEDVTITITSHFAFNIFSYEIGGQKYDINTGESVHGVAHKLKEYLLDKHPLSDRNRGFDSKELKGDVIKARWNGHLQNNEEVDFRIRGAHLPILDNLYRSVFWGIIWVIVILVFVSPFLEFFLQSVLGVF